MKTLVAVPHHEYPAQVRAMVEERAQSLLRYYERIVSIRALLERQGDRHRVELVAHVGHGATLVVEADADLLAGAVDQAIDRMGRVLKRHKTRFTERHRRSGRAGR